MSALDGGERFQRLRVLPPALPADVLTAYAARMGWGKERARREAGVRITRAVDEALHSDIGALHRLPPGLEQIARDRFENARHEIGLDEGLEMFNHEGVPIR